MSGHDPFLPPPQAQADIVTAHAWGLTLTQWHAMTDHERAEARPHRHHRTTIPGGTMNTRTPAKVLMDWIEQNSVELRGATPAMLVSALAAGGYPLPWPRIIETAEELDALPAGSIVLDDNGDAELKVTTPQSWLELRPEGALEDSVNLPASVLYEPEGK